MPELIVGFDAFMQEHRRSGEIQRDVGVLPSLLDRWGREF